MYPTGELARLSARKALIQVRIAGHRWQCAESGAALARPIEVVDDLWAKWRRISPIAKVVGAPIAMMVARKFFRKLSGIASIARFVPMILQVARMVSGRNKAEA